ncbi:hypothetical protein [Mesorhizobium sp.]|uniref:hypothetical protein n=1 Tax=Mesorhizobium sp. TaxID=1871066 RepID=UPI00257C3575|nr:hypothetical protein [Mesorhizobium sp.]
MTTTVKVHVNGKYKATCKHSVDGEPYTTVEVGPQEEKHIHMHHGHVNTVEITEEPVGE